MPRTAETKDDRLQVRLDAESKSVLQRAASYRHKTVSQFVLATALEEAAKVIRENEIVTLSSSDWKVFYDASPTGVFNTILGWVGLGPFPWLQDATWAMPSLVLEATWAAAGGTVIIYLAALTGVPTELYDAVEVDGAGLWRKIWHITLPQLRGILLITLILQVIGTAQVFLEPFLFTDGGPANSTLTVLLLIYRYAFGNSLGGDYGAATALSLMLAAFLAVLSAVYLRLTRSWSTS